MLRLADSWVGTRFSLFPPSSPSGEWAVNIDENGFKEEYHNEAGRKRDGDKTTRKGGA